MYEELSVDFTSCLAGKIPDEYLNTVKDEFMLFINNYEVQKRTTEMQLYEYILPKEVERFIMESRIIGRSAKTLAGYSLILKNFFLAVGKAVKDVTTDDVFLYLGTYKEKRHIADRTLEHYRIVINTFFEWCLTSEFIVKNPCKKIKPVKYQKFKESALTDYQVESIRSQCKTDRDLAMIDFMLSTGCRISETLSVKKSDIDFKEGRLDVIGKGNKKRTVYLNGKCQHSLQKYLESRTDTNDYLFVSERKPYGNINKEAVEKLLRSIGKAAGVGRLHPHQLRRTMATNALKRGMDITIVQKILGHENIETTMRYVNVAQEDVENAHRRYVA